MATITEDFINKALREFMGLLNTCKDALKFGEKQSVIGARLNASSQESYRKSEKAMRKGAEDLNVLASEALGLKTEKQSSDTPAPRKSG